MKVINALFIGLMLGSITTSGIMFFQMQDQVEKTRREASDRVSFCQDRARADWDGYRFADMRRELEISTLNNKLAERNALIIRLARRPITP